MTYDVENFRQNLKRIDWSGGQKTIAKQLVACCERNGIQITPEPHESEAKAGTQITRKCLENLARVFVKWKGITKPKLENLTIFAKLLNVSLDELFGTNQSQNESAQIKQSVLNYLVAQGCPRTDLDIVAVRRFLDSKQIDGDLNSLARRICSWAEFSFAFPNSAELILLSKVFRCPVSSLLGETTTPQTILLSYYDWFANFIQNECRLQCYMVVIEKSVVADFRSKHLANDPSGDGIGDPEKVAPAKTFLAGIPIRAMSTALADTHEWGRAPSNRTVKDAIEARLKWIKDCGEDLVSAFNWAHERAYTQAFNSLAFGSIGKLDRYPTTTAQEGKPVERSLQVTFERLPDCEDKVGWIVYYFWHDAFTLDEKSRFLQRSTSSTSRTLTSRKQKSPR